MEAIDRENVVARPGWARVSPSGRLLRSRPPSPLAGKLVLQPVSVRADRLGAMALFDGLPRTELEFAAGFFRETLIGRGTRITIQGRPCSCLWLISEGEALVSADARPLRVVGRGDAIGAAAMLHSIRSPETTIALGPIAAFEAGRDQFRRLIARRAIRLCLAAAAGDQLRSRRPAVRSSRSKAELPDR